MKFSCNQTIYLNNLKIFCPITGRITSRTSVEKRFRIALFNRWYKRSCSIGCLGKFAKTNLQSGPTTIIIKLH